MALEDLGGQADKIDPELKEFIVNEQIKAQIQSQIKKLNSICFEKCVEKPGSKLESKQETCISSEEEEAFLLIRLPKETIDRKRQSGDKTTKVGSIFVYNNNKVEFQDDGSHKLYTLMRNDPTHVNGLNPNGSQRRHGHVVSNEESDLFKISLQKEEALHLGKVKLSTLLAVPKADETGASVVSV